MADDRLKKLARNILGYSVDLKQGERLMIRGPLSAKPVIMELVKQANAIGAMPFVRILDEELSRCMLEGATDGRLELENKWDMDIYQDIDADVSFISEENDSEFSSIDPAIMQRRAHARRPWVDLVTRKKKWVLLNWPTKGQAQNARMPYEEFYDFVIDASSMDYSQMKKNMQPLAELMSQTDNVRITGPGTELTFSIKGIPNVICAGENNLPDGELFTAPVKHSVEGVLSYNTPSLYHGRVYRNVRLEFKKGKIVKASAESGSDALNAIFDTDEGARYIGEFSFGLNPHITKPFGNTLFDEKICGSFHFTPGCAYETAADNGNRSAIHWDMVCIQTKEYGGGEIWFDGVLIRKDGMFVLPELKALNP
ncbi:MAG: aminopeptidase [Burkholderiales bacterium]